MTAQMRVLAKACQLASETIPHLELPARFLLETVVQHHALSDGQVIEARMAAEAADDRHFQLRDEGAQEDHWQEWFRKARLLLAMATGFGGSSWKDTADALYELCYTRDDPHPIISLAECEIDWASRLD